MEKEFKKMAPPQKEFMMRGHMPPPGFSPLKNRKEPPLYIPLIAIISLSSILIYLLLSYLDKNFISPKSIFSSSVIFVISLPTTPVAPRIAIFGFFMTSPFWKKLYHKNLNITFIRCKEPLISFLEYFFKIIFIIKCFISTA